MKTLSTSPSRSSSLRALASGLVAAASVACAQAALAAGYTVQQVKSPGPAMGMSESGAVTGFYVAKCTTLSSQPKRTICYNAPWLFDGARVNKLAGSFTSNANAKAVAVNDSLALVGGDINGAWYYANGVVTHTDEGSTTVRGTRLYALNNAGVAVGMSTVNVGGVYIYMPVTYENVAGVTPVLEPGKTIVDINDAGMIVGWYKDTLNTDKGFVAPASGTPVEIPKIPKTVNCRPVHISEVGANGDVWVAGHCDGRPFIYNLNSNSVEPVELGVGRYTSLSVQAVNSSGEAVGTGVRPNAAAPDGYTAVLWDAAGGYGSPKDLNALQPFAPSGAWNLHATDINEAGTILTGCNDISGNFYTYLLRPAP